MHVLLCLMTAVAGAGVVTAQQGMNPDIWFNNVGRVTAAKIGQEPVRYVRNIYKYYIAYKLLEEHSEAVDTARQMPPAKQ